MLNNNEYLEGLEIAKELVQLYKDINGKLWKDNFTVNNYTLNKVIISPKETDKIKRFNEVYKKIAKCKSFTELVRTKSGGISIDKQTLLERPFQYDIRKTTINATITFITDQGCGKIVCGYGKTKKESDDYFGRGSTCSKKLWELANECGLKEEDYICENGIEEAKKIHAPDNLCYALADDGTGNHVYYNVHHLDFHKFYPSGVIECYPEFRQVFEKCLTIKGGKQLLDAGTRYWASKYCNYRYAKLIKDGINKSYEHLDKVFEDLCKSGRKILMVNTDGIWYQGDIYHGELEGPSFGQWSNDYINCKWRTRTTSTGCYEFVGTDTKTNNIGYFAKVKGNSSYEAIKPRENWIWGDIFKGEVIKCSWDDENGFIVEGVIE